MQCLLCPLDVQAHDASILKVAWAHPEYGQVLASCSFDRSIRIWEEDQSAATVSSSTSAAAASTATGTPGDTSATSRRWLEKARLVDSRGSVQDIAFAPNHLGLKLATVSVDGTLRIYEAMDVINLAHWTLMVGSCVCARRCCAGHAVESR